MESRSSMQRCQWRRGALISKNDFNDNRTDEKFKNQVIFKKNLTHVESCIAGKCRLCARLLSVSEGNASVVFQLARVKM